MRSKTVVSVLGTMLLIITACGPKEWDIPEGSKLPERDATSYFKGVEIYSWQDTNTGVWYVSAQGGTNRQKSANLVLNGEGFPIRPIRELRDIEQVKRMLHGFAPGETIGWEAALIGETPEHIQWGLPEWLADPATQTQLIEYCRDLDITLFF